VTHVSRAMALAAVLAVTASVAHAQAARVAPEARIDGIIAARGALQSICSTAANSS
jgi:hypothetical protein